MMFHDILPFHACCATFGHITPYDVFEFLSFQNLFFFLGGGHFMYVSYGINLRTAQISPAIEAKDFHLLEAMSSIGVIFSLHTPHALPLGVS